MLRRITVNKDGVLVRDGDILDCTLCKNEATVCRPKNWKVMLCLCRRCDRAYQAGVTAIKDKIVRDVKAVTI